jgi:hypothetical protein
MMAKGNSIAGWLESRPFFLNGSRRLTPHACPSSLRGGGPRWAIATPPGHQPRKNHGLDHGAAAGSPGRAGEKTEIGPGSENIFEFFTKMLDFLFEVGEMKIKF